MDAESLACIGIEDNLADLIPEAAELDSKGCYSQTRLTSGDQLREVPPDYAVVRDGPNSAMAKAEEGACEPTSAPEEQERKIQV
jgi:hypothetical protein